MRRHVSSCLCVAASILMLATPARSQTVGFFHGFNDSPNVWYSASTSLAATFGFTADRPTLPSSLTYEDQRASIAGRYDTTAILVGHSNGGIVAPYYGQNQHVRGVVTFGSPNHGAPLVAQSYSVQVFLGGTAYDIVTTLQMIPNVPDILPGGTEQDLYWGAQLLASISDAYLTATGWVGAPVQNEMLHYSDYVLNTMNGSAAVAAETSNIEVEGSVAFTTSADGAIYRLLWPGTGSAYDAVLDGAGYALVGAASAIYLYGDPDDFQLASRLDNVGADILNVDFVWCTAVSGSLMCLPNDGIVPAWSQALGRGFSTLQETSYTHLTEPQGEGVPALTNVFQTYFGY